MSGRVAGELASSIGALSPKSGLEKLDIDTGELEVWEEEGSVSEGISP